MTHELRQAVRDGLVAAASLLIMAVMTMPAAAHPASVLGSPPAPSPRFEAGMAYDAAHGQTVLFGGAEVHWVGDTWVRDGAGWAQLHPAHSPSPRNYPGMAYDAVHGQVVLFGGYSRTGDLADTWTWDGTDWTLHHPAHSPSKRGSAAMVYDEARGQIVLFGGFWDGEYLGDTWTWDGTDWMELHPAHSPSARAQAGIGADPLGHLVLFGGDAESGLLGDTWAWDGTDWTHLTPVHSPPARKNVGGMIASDAALGQVVLFAGIGDGRYLDDTWTWDGRDWTERSLARSPSSRWYGMMAGDGSHGGVVLFGGIAAHHGTPSGLLGDTWTWDGASWALGSVGAIKVAPRSGPPGTTVTVRGWGFAAREHVRISFHDSTKGSTFLADERTDGRGALTVQVTVPSGATIGKQTVKAKAEVSGQVAKRAFTVT